ncbi:unnamed protein product [Coccothraustes coccothraustes]
MRVGGRGGYQRGVPEKHLEEGSDAPASLLALLSDGGAGRDFVLHPRPTNCAQVQPPLRAGSSALGSLRNNAAPRKRRKASSPSSQVRRNLVQHSPLHLRRGQRILHGCARLGLRAWV